MIGCSTRCSRSEFIDIASPEEAIEVLLQRASIWRRQAMELGGACATSHHLLFQAQRATETVERCSSWLLRDDYPNVRGALLSQGIAIPMWR